MAGLVVIHRLGFQRGPSTLSAAQLRATPRFRFESNRFRREPDSPSTDQSAPLPPRRALNGVQVHGAGGRTCTLRHSLMPPSAEIFPSTRLDTALSKARAASNDALVHKALHPPRIPKRPAQGNGRSNQTYRSEDSSGRSPLTPRHQQSPRPNNQSNAQSPNGNGRKRGNRRPFPQPTDRSGYSGGKRKGSGKCSN